MASGDKNRRKWQANKEVKALKQERTGNSEENKRKQEGSEPLGGYGFAKDCICLLNIYIAFQEWNFNLFLEKFTLMWSKSIY